MAKAPKAGVGHNSGSVDNDTRTQLRSFIERIERLLEEKKTIADDIKDVKGEAKGFGYDVKAIMTLIKIRAADRNQRLEEQSILQTYAHALGIELYDDIDDSVADEGDEGDAEDSQDDDV